MTRASDLGSIVCLGAEREVRDGRVVCPLRLGPSTPVHECATCRLLGWWPDERERASECSTEPATKPV